MNSDLVLCDEMGNIVDIEDEPISLLSQLKSRFHSNEEESMGLQDHVEPVRIEHHEKSSGSRQRNNSDKRHDNLTMDRKHCNMY